MARQRRQPTAPQDTTLQVIPVVPVEVASGLEAIRSHGDRDEELYISAENAFFEEAFMTDRIITAEEAVKFIKKIEALIRGSREYKSYISFLRNDMGMDRCSFLSGLDMSMDEIGLEMHHCPLTLYSIVDIVITHRLARNQPVTSLSVADEVMQMHFENKVGMVPLCRSAHKLVHSGGLTVHPAMVQGDWIGLLRAYPDGVTEEIVSQLLTFLNVTEESVMQNAMKIDGTQATPLLRSDVVTPTYEQVNMLLMAPSL